MKQSRLIPTVIPNIWATRPEFPFGGTSFKASAFWIQRPAGNNVWIYSSSYAGEYVNHVAELGGVTYQLLNHRDEASKFSNVLDAPVFCHELEKEAIEQNGAVVGETYQGDKYVFDEDLVAHHTPGHAAGVTTYFYKHNDTGQTVLFTGDTLYPNSNGKLVHGPLQFHSYPGNREDMLKTLKFYLDVNPTYVISGLTQSEFCTKFDPNQVQEQIEALSKCSADESSS